MDWVSVLGSATTVISFVAFVGIVVWAWSSRRQAAFAAAANAPFALPEEGPEDAVECGGTRERS